MTAERVRDLVHRQIGSGPTASNLHGVDLRTCLIDPPRPITLLDAEEEPLAAWLVLHEDPEHERGYGVVFEEPSGAFGLAHFAPEREPRLVGMYGEFLDALRAM